MYLSIYLSLYLSMSLCLSLCLSIVPLPVVTISPGSVNVSYNSTVTLTCNVQSLTTPTVTWTSNTEVILPSTSHVSNNDIHTTTLTLEQVTLEYIGEYTCSAVNEGGERNHMINVNVYGKNMCVSVYLSIYLFIYLSIYLSIYLCLSVSLCLSLYSSSSSGYHFSWIC